MQIKVLIADDHAIIRDGLRLILEANNINVVGEAADGIQAVTMTRELQPDVVLMDVGMPNMNGIEAMNRIFEERISTKVVILSMLLSLEDIYRALKAGAIGYVLKESASSEVIEAIHAACNNQKYFSKKVNDILIDSYVHDLRGTPSLSPLDTLSSREREILQMISEGKTSRETAKLLFLSVKTIETYRSRLMKKLGLKDVAELIKFALQHGLSH